MAQNLEKVPKYAHKPYILACHLQMIRIHHVDAVPDADPDLSFQFDMDLCGSASTTLEFLFLTFLFANLLRHPGWTFVCACFKLLSFRVIHPAPGSKFCPF
jgi:hypothetical protein